MIPREKITKGQKLIYEILEKPSKKTTVKKLQQLAGFLNFIGRAVVPGRAFTRRLYAYTKGSLQPHHHVQVNNEIRADLTLWLKFLHHPSVYARPFIDFSVKQDVLSSRIESDASGNFNLRAGVICDKEWSFIKWDPSFMKQFNPSIQYLKLFGVLIGFLNWGYKFSNKRITIACDNQSVVDMINNSSSTCKNCMILITILILQALKVNIRVSAVHLPGCENEFCDALSHLQFDRFWTSVNKRN